jgi:hypothetical protein
MFEVQMRPVLFDNMPTDQLEGKPSYKVHVLVHVSKTSAHGTIGVKKDFYIKKKAFRSRALASMMDVCLRQRMFFFSVSSQEAKKVKLYKKNKVRMVVLEMVSQRKKILEKLQVRFLVPPSM